MSVPAGAPAATTSPARPVIVVKIGGSLLSRVELLDAVLAELARASADDPLLVVPGGGPFADAVRTVDGAIGLGDDAAHWMSVLAMDQYAHLIACRMPRGRVVANREEIAAATRAGAVPVLAPFWWLRREDPLPHSWDVTGDSIAAWVAAQLGAQRVVLVKQAGASGPSLVDPAFDGILPDHITPVITTADRIGMLRSALRST